MKKILCLLYIAFVCTSTAMVPRVKKQKQADLVIEDDAKNDYQEYIVENMSALNLVEDLIAEMPLEVQSLIAQFLYDGSNVEAFLKRNDDVSCQTREISACRTATCNRAADMVVLADHASAVSVVSVESGECLQVFNDQERRVSSCVFNKAGDMILIASGYGAAKLWSVATGECLQIFGHGEVLHQAVFNTSEDTVITFSFVAMEAMALQSVEIQVWSVESGDCLKRTVIPTPYAVLLFNGEDDLVFTHSMNNRAELWSFNTGQCIQTFENGLLLSSAVLTKSADKIITTSPFTVVQMWSVASGECLLTLEGRARRALLNEAEDTVLTASADAVKLWSLESGECLQTFHHTALRAEAFNQDNVVTVSRDGILKLWNRNFWNRFRRSLTLPQLYLLGNIRQVAKQRLWLKLKEDEGVAVFTHDGKRVTKDQLVIDVNAAEYVGLQAQYEALPEEIKDSCNEYLTGLSL